MLLLVKKYNWNWKQMVNRLPASTAVYAVTYRLCHGAAAKKAVMLLKPFDMVVGAFLITFLEKWTILNWEYILHKDFMSEKKKIFLL
jgi:hypothetical protein